MACILHIETTTKVCSVAVSQDGQCLFEKADYEGPSHAVLLGPYVQEALSFADNHAIPVDAVAVSCGPGSYTGLRIGVSMAKGICYGRKLPLISVSTLELLCVPVLLYHEELPENVLLCPMLDARRMEVYSAIYDRSLHVIRPIGADVVTGDTFKSYLEQGPVCFFGNGSEKCRKVLDHPNASFIENVNPLACNMLPLAERSVILEHYEDVAYFEPFYLKEFVASIPKNKLNGL